MTVDFARQQFGLLVKKERFLGFVSCNIHEPFERGYLAGQIIRRVIESGEKKELLGHFPVVFQQIFAGRIGDGPVQFLDAKLENVIQMVIQRHARIAGDRDLFLALEKTGQGGFVRGVSQRQITWSSHFSQQFIEFDIGNYQHLIAVIVQVALGVNPHG